jgi:hypothetical protein
MSHRIVDSAHPFAPFSDQTRHHDLGDLFWHLGKGRDRVRRSSWYERKARTSDVSRSECLSLKYQMICRRFTRRSVT